MNCKVNITAESADITDFRPSADDSNKGVVVCDNETTTMSLPIDRKFQINPSCGDKLKYLIVSLRDDDSNIEIIPIEIKVRNMKTKLTIDYNKVIDSMGLRLSSEKSVFSRLAFLKFSKFLKISEFSESKTALSEKDKFIKVIDDAARNSLNPYKGTRLY